ncbi:MAG TPA: cobalamin-independent methionine synthase II family protein [Chloroflexota bacterium]
MTARYRADQVGSLLRPSWLVEAKLSEGPISEGEMRQLEDRAILEALDLQRQVGIDVFTDGEFRRRSYMTGFWDAIEGFVAVPPDEYRLQWRGTPRENYPRTMSCVVAAKLRPKRRLAGDEAAFLKEHAAGHEFKITLPGAHMIGGFGFKPGLTDKVYASRQELLMDLGRLLRDEIVALIADGVPYIQMDAPGYAGFLDQNRRTGLLDDGIQLDRALDEAIAADNAAVEGLQRDGVTLAIHLCRGNSGGQWLAEGGYDPIAEKLFNTLRHDTFLLEYDTDRAGNFEPLRFMPRDKTVVLGLVTTKSGQLESQDQLLRRIDEAANYVPRENLALSPQCGFASSIPGNPLTPDDQRRKLELVVDTARKVWG